MKNALVIIASIFLLFFVWVVCEFISAYNYGNKSEQQIQAEYKDMENILGQYSLKVKETAQVPDMMADDLKRVTVASMTARYGEHGSTGAMQWIKENYAGKISPVVYKQIQQVIEAGRNKFENAQTKFIDTKRAYKTSLGYLVKGAFLRFAGYPKIDLSKFVVISSEHAVSAFKTGLGKQIKLR